MRAGSTRSAVTRTRPRCRRHRGDRDDCHAPSHLSEPYVLRARTETARASLESPDRWAKGRLMMPTRRTKTRALERQPHSTAIRRVEPARASISSAGKYSAISATWARREAASVFELGRECVAGGPHVGPRRRICTRECSWPCRTRHCPRRARRRLPRRPWRALRQRSSPSSAPQLRNAALVGFGQLLVPRREDLFFGGVRFIGKHDVMKTLRDMSTAFSSAVTMRSPTALCWWVPRVGEDLVFRPEAGEGAHRDGTRRR